MGGRAVAVTGATGFLGSAVVEQLLKDDYRVRSLVRNAKGVSGEVFTGDLKTGGWPDAAFEGADAVIHCAASIGGPLHHQRLVNRDGSRMVARQSKAQRVERFVHISSIAVYGYGGTAFPESRPLTPSAQAYATTKAEAEGAVRAEFPEAVIIRPGGIFGPGARFWSAKFVKRAKRRLAFNIGRGSGTLPVAFVSDVADLAVTAINSAAAPGEAFNCCLDSAPTWREYQAAYGRLVGVDRWIPLPTSLARAAAWVVARLGRAGSNAAVMDELLSFALRSKVFPMDKARALLGWQPEHTLDEAVAITARWLEAEGLV